MAERRMFAKSIIDSDAFLDMPMSAQALYFHLSMRADDDGFVNNPRKIQRMVGAGDDDAKILLAKRFIIAFDSGVVVIKHWRIHNYINPDRYKPTPYVEEKAMLTKKPNGAYTLAEPEERFMSPKCDQNGDRMVPEWCQGGAIVAPQDSIGKDKVSQDREKDARVTRFTPPSVEEVRAYCQERGNSVDPERFVDFYASKGWKVGNASMKDWRAAVRNWERDDRRPKQTSKLPGMPKGPVTDDTDRLARMLGLTEGGNG